jgi:uncharacterized protein involved in exopolysaccharide biosynthesis
VSFAPQGNDASKAGLAGIASQFGVALPAGSQALSPDYYAKLLKSNALLRPVAADSFIVPELGRHKVAFADLLEIKSPNALERQDKLVLRLTQMINTSVSKATGIIDVTVDTKWRSVSIEIAQALIDGVNDFNQRTRQEQAGAERRFVEGQLTTATQDLRTAEDRLEEFLHGNKQYTSSPELALERDRLQNSIDQRRQVVTSLTQSYQEVRLREVRDTPVITVIESPSAPATPEPRGRSKVVLLGVMLGGFLGVAIVLFSEMISRRRASNDPAATEFLGQWSAFRRDLAAPFRWLTRRKGR